MRDGRFVVHLFASGDDNSADVDNDETTGLLVGLPGIPVRARCAAVPPSAAEMTPARGADYRCLVDPPGDLGRGRARHAWFQEPRPPRRRLRMKSAATAPPAAWPPKAAEAGRSNASLGGDSRSHGDPGPPPAGRHRDRWSPNWPPTTQLLGEMSRPAHSNGALSRPAPLQRVALRWSRRRHHTRNGDHRRPAAPGSVVDDRIDA